MPESPPSAPWYDRITPDSRRDGLRQRRARPGVVARSRRSRPVRRGAEEDCGTLPGGLGERLPAASGPSAGAPYG